MAYEQPKVDVAAVTAVLDGKYVDVRNLVRTNLAQAAGILEDQENLGTDEFRDRVRDLVVEMAATGQTGMGFPEEYGGGGDIGASIAAFETLAFGDLSVLVKVGVQFGLFGGAILQLGTKRHHDALLADLITGRLMGCFAMTETGHGSNVQALGTTATYDAATQEFVIHTPDDRLAQGLHRQRGPARRRGGGLRAARDQRRLRGRARVRRAAARGRRGAARRTHRGRRAQDGPQRRRQRPDLVRPGAGAARRAAQPVRGRDRRTAPTSPRSRTPTGASSRCSARWCRAGSASAAPRSTRRRSR